MAARRADLSLAVVCPMANEADTAVQFVGEVLEHCRGFRETKMLVVLDHVSTDNTRQLIEELARTTPEVEVIWAPENRGIADAYVRGHREALARGADWILEIDAGFSHQPSDIPLLLARMEEGYDCVFGSRFSPGGSLKDSSLGHYLVSYGGTFLTNLLLGTKLHDMTSGFQLFSRAAVDMILRRGIHARGPFFQTEMKTYCRRLRIAEVPIQYSSASHHVGRKAISDALSNLGRLFGLRLLGQV
ncbi:MAG: glycosyltransferase family 2 protein [Chthoniobacterales bacterium]